MGENKYFKILPTVSLSGLYAYFSMNRQYRLASPQLIAADPLLHQSTYMHGSN
jgi:hypothetical protein